ncbi:homoserine kinase [Mitsuokella sp. AF33-22]|uniref:homoserine kinase n=1 Tax=Mitsuokella sp. AF33-22 TaxID=2292047 RepID=UPI000E471271|nr:homoserine kinase [Mitsuokella sp. AF33-22]RHM56772.1 homoserine kinase [Mitsuokella sp. AF33-22]
MAEKMVRVRVPGTSANCGPGFDTLGLACTIYNDLGLRLTREPGLSITMTGEGAANIPCDARNIVWRSVQYLLQKAGCSKDYRGAVIHMENHVPLSRGLGSSATAIVAGLTAANALIGNRYNRYELLEFATDIEGHPDNVAPAIFGGFTVNAVTDGHVDCFHFRPNFRLKLVVAVPDFPLSTRMARKVLPEEVPLKDAIFNVGRASMLVAALTRGNERFLRHAFDDSLHQPYRAKLIPGMYDVFAAARAAGAAGATLSGAGPCLIAYVLERRHVEEAVGKAMQEAFRKHGVKSRILTLDLDTRGAHLLRK